MITTPITFDQSPLSTQELAMLIDESGENQTLDEFLALLEKNVIDDEE